MKQKLKDSFLYAFQRSMPIMIGYFALGSANGILMAQKGYSVGLTGIASLFIYAGTQQMLLSGTEAYIEFTRSISRHRFLQYEVLRRRGNQFFIFISSVLSARYSFYG